MRDVARSRERALASYPLTSLAALTFVAVADLLELGAGARVGLGLSVLSLSVFGLLAWGWLPAAESTFRSRILFRTLGHPLEGTDGPAGGTETAIPVTRVALGLHRAAARSGPSEEGPTVWIPAETSTRAVWLRASGASMLVGAQARPAASRFARVDFRSFRPVYVLLSSGESGERAGQITVPGLARDFVDQEVSAEWLEDVTDLPGDDVAAIAASVACSNHATRAAWRSAVAGLPADDPIRVAVSETT